MDKKNKISLAALAVVAGVGTTVVGVELINNQHKAIKAEECSHGTVMEYIDSVATSDKPGHHHHVACCNCHLAWSDFGKTDVIGRTAPYGEEPADRSKIDCYKIDWTENQYDLGNGNKTLYEYAKDSKRIEIINSDSTDGVRCGKNKFDLVYASWNQTSEALKIWSPLKIAFTDDDIDGKGFGACNKAVAMDLSNLDTVEVPRMDYMFSGCESLLSLDLSSFDTKRVNNMSHLFNECFNLKSLNLSSFDTSLVEDMTNMFDYCISLSSLDISSFEVGETIKEEGSLDTSEMFGNMEKLQTIYTTDKFDLTDLELSGSDLMFYGCEKLVGGQGTPYSDEHTDKEYARIDDAMNGNPGYFTAKK